LNSNRERERERDSNVDKQNKESYEDRRLFNLNFLFQERLNEKAHYDIGLSNVTP